PAAQRMDYADALALTRQTAVVVSREDSSSHCSLRRALVAGRPGLCVRAGADRPTTVAERAPGGSAQRSTGGRSRTRRPLVVRAACLGGEPDGEAAPAPL